MIWSQSYQTVFFVKTKILSLFAIRRGHFKVQTIFLFLQTLKLNDENQKLKLVGLTPGRTDDETCLIQT